MAMARRAQLQDQAVFQQQLEKNRQREVDLQSMEMEKKMAQYIEENIRREEKVKQKRFMRQQEIMNKEMEMNDAILKAERDRLLKQQQIDQEENLARELERVKFEQLRDEKMRQQIRETSLELRELEAKLRAAYTNKERAAQIAERESMKYDEMKRESEIARHMKEQNERAEEAEHQREMERYKEMARYQQELERQLEEQEAQKQQAYEEFLKEKLMIDEIVRKIYEEDQRELERQLQKRQVTQQYIEEFKRAREEWKLQEKKKMEEENQRILHFARQMQEREEYLKTQKKEKDSAMSKVQDALAQEIARKEAERAEMEKIRLELVLEETEERERQREMAEMERQIRQKIDLQSTHAQQLHYKALRQEAEKAEEEEFRKQMLAKFAEDDRLEQMNAQRRRMKQLEHQRAVEKLLEDRRVQFAREREAEVEARLEEAKLEQFRKRVIEEERQKLLKEHAIKLLGYLPRGVIRDEKDLDILGPQFKDAYSQRQIDPFDDLAWNSK
uniref:Meiosis-specific nuclear structural protein 1 n=1 Tax=Biomphalaria glabrata TaxID=6526 RepID=A0A2C9JVV5_BIOGL